MLIQYETIDFGNPQRQFRGLVEMINSRNDMIAHHLGKYSITYVDALVYGEIERILEKMFCKENVI